MPISFRALCFVYVKRSDLCGVSLLFYVICYAFQSIVVLHPGRWHNLIHSLP